MKQAKEYVFKRKSVVLELIFCLVWLMPILIFLLIIFTHPIMYLIAIFLPIIIFYFQCYSLYMVYQFNKYDKGKIVTISEDRQTIALSQGGSTTYFTTNDVERVELYEQKSLGKFDIFSYMVVYTYHLKPVIITRFTIPRLGYDDILSRFLSKKPRTTFIKWFNYIDEKKFSPK